MIAEWSKTVITTLIGAVVGFLSAVASEVWKSNRAERKHVRRIELALYAEMAELYRQFRDFRTEDMVKDPHTTAALMKHYLVADAYKYQVQPSHVL
jgi:hypothetical protein